MSKKKLRADEWLLERGLVANLREAQAYIMAGDVFTVKEERVDTAGQTIEESQELYIKNKKKKYVSRGGYKLEKAVDNFKLSIDGKIALDIGSSTGGFTDVFLKNGARKVYALDVGTNQLVWELRQDSRVIVMEGCNFRYAERSDFTEGQPEIASFDVSFISLKLLLPVLKSILISRGEVIALVKPQFEAKREDVGDNGIVSDSGIHEKVLFDILSFAIQEGYSIHGLSYSPIQGQTGNIEFLLYLTNESNNSSLAIEEVIPAVVKEAHEMYKDI